MPLRVAPPGIGAVIPGRQVAGRALPARHYGSVDVFLEALGSAGYGDVLVVDNGGRADEACVGDLVVLEAQAAGVSGMVVWGLHRDTSVRGSLSSGAGEFPGDSGALVLSWGSCYGWR